MKYGMSMKLIQGKTNKFRNICETIHRNLRNKTKHSTIIKFYETIAIYSYEILTYVNEMWVVTNKERVKIQSAEMQFLQKNVNYKLQDRRGQKIRTRSK